MKSLRDSCYYAWVIGTKDILDAVKNKTSLVNIIVILFMVVFFYWMSELRPFDKQVGVVIYDEGDPALTIEKFKLADGTEYTFRQASSLQDMEQKMASQNLGVVIPAGFDQTLSSGGMPTLSGYIFWVNRQQVGRLEAKYSQAFTEVYGHPVQVAIGNNIIIPQASAGGEQTNITYLMVYFVFTTALLVIPHLMLEEKQTRTMDALLSSPVSAGQIVVGKALAGFFYIVLVGGLALALFSQYIVNWALALVTLLGYALLAIGLGLLAGSMLKSFKQLGASMFVLALILMVPPLFYTAPNLKEWIRLIFTWVPTSVLASLLRFSCSTGFGTTQLIPNFAVVLLSIGIVFGLVTWKVHRSAR